MPIIYDVPGTYHFTGAVAYDRLGSSWRTAAGLRSVSVIDGTTGLLPTGLVQDGVPVTWLTADAHSRYSFTCDVPGVVVDFGAGAEALYANEVPMLATSEATTVQAIADDAAASAASAAASASLVGAPADTAVAVIVGNPASATRVSLDATFATVPKAAKNALTGWFHADGYGLAVANTAGANDTAFAAAHAAMESGDTLYIPAGLYLFGTFAPTKAIHIKGSGNSHVLNQKAFGYANWTDGTAYASDFISGTILQSNATTGSAIFLDNAGLLNHSAISDIVLVGPGSGSSIGLTVGDPTSAIGYPVRTRLNNVAVANFAVGIDATCENATWNGVYIVGCSTGLSTHYPFNGNTINGLNIELSSVRALSMEASDGNVFNGGVIQGHSAGAAIYLRGCWTNRFFFYVEGTASSGPQEDVVLEQDTGTGHTNLHCSDNIIDGFWATHASALPVIRIDAQQVRNEFRGSGPHAAVAYNVANAGASNVFLMSISGTVTDTGRNNAYRDNTFSAGTFLPFTLMNGTASMWVDDSLWIQTVASIVTHLPDPTTVRKGKVYRVKNATAGTTTVDSDGTSKTIDGAASKTLAAWAALSFISDGTQWLTI